MKRGPYKHRALSLEKIAPFEDIFRHMVTNTRAHFNILDANAACDAIPDVDGLGRYELYNKIKANYGNLAAKMFTTYFGEAGKIIDKKKIKVLGLKLQAGKITYEEYCDSKCKCYKYQWTLLECWR